MHRETKAKAIPKEVKRRVWERDNGECVICHAPGEPTAHYIGRGQGGLGIEENIVTLCHNCHRMYDQTSKRDWMRSTLKSYLKKHYPDWDESKLYYRKDYEK